MASGITKTIDGGWVVISGICSVTKEKYSVRVPLDEYMRWIDLSPSTRLAMPSLSDEQRWFVMRGITPAEAIKLHVEARGYIQTHAEGAD
jgi:hypothetical protein